MIDELIQNTEGSYILKGYQIITTDYRDYFIDINLHMYFGLSISK